MLKFSLILRRYQMNVLERVRSIWNVASDQKVDEADFMTPHFAKVAFLVSFILLALFSSVNFLLSASIGAAFHHQTDPAPKIKVNKINSSDAIFGMIGAFSAVLKRTPIGQAGNILFHSIPLCSAFSIGWTVYRLFAATE